MSHVATSMPATHRTRLRLTSAATLLALTFGACAATPDFIPVTPAQGQALGIVAQRVVAAGIAASAGLPATVSIPNNQVRVIAAPLSGVVESLETAPGMSVRKGQVLARIASPQALELQRDRLQAEAQAGLSRQSLKRDEQLFREGLIAESRVQASRANAAQNAAQAAERRQALALAQYSGGQTLSLIAPIAGSVLEQTVSVGQRVEQAAPLYRIARLDPLSVEIQAPLAIAGQVKIGTVLRVPSADASGEVIAVGRSVDPANQSVLLRGLITRGAQNLRPGQATSIDLEVRTAGATTVQVPGSAVLHQQGKQWIFITARDGNSTGYRALPVSVAGKLGDAVLVSGLPADALVVTAGVAALKASWLGIGKE
mgnify:CR=1 FL=1|jgi:membrane fusion protein, heavy metal efflux system